MSIICFGNVAVMGNFAKLSRKKPKSYNKEYKVIVPFDFEWRHKIGKVECTCTECEEHYMPYYGWSWFHSPECEIMKLIKKRPGIANLRQYYGRNFRMIAQTD